MHILGCHGACIFFAVKTEESRKRKKQMFLAVMNDYAGGRFLQKRE